jgi:hypothetical protein
MATGTAGTNARQYHQHQIHYLRADFTYLHPTGVPISMGFLPAGAVIIASLSGVQVHTAFTAGTNKQADVGTPANDDLYGTDLSLASIGYVTLDELAASLKVAVDTEIIVTPDHTGATDTAGDASCIIAYTLPDVIAL